MDPQPQPELIESVRSVARRLHLLDADGRLLALDSLALIDLVVGLEAALKLRIPTASLRQESFETVESVASMIAEINAPD